MTVQCRLVYGVVSPRRSWDLQQLLRHSLDQRQSPESCHFQATQGWSRVKVLNVHSQWLVGPRSMETVPPELEFREPYITISKHAATMPLGTT